MSSAAVALRNVMLAIAALQPALPFRTAIVRRCERGSSATSTSRAASTTPDLEASHG
jgi:hypothetical protein